MTMTLLQLAIAPSVFLSSLPQCKAKLTEVVLVKRWFESCALAKFLGHLIR